MYDLTFFPEKTLSITPEMKETKIQETFIIQSWIDRLLNMIDPQELDFFTLEELIQSIVDTSFEDEDVPPQAISAAIIKYRATL